MRIVKWYQSFGRHGGVWHSMRCPTKRISDRHVKAIKKAGYKRVKVEVL